MASKRVALLGTKKGPWVRLTHLRGPFLRISTLPEGTRVIAAVKKEGDADVVVDFLTDGDHDLPKGDWLQLRCEGTHEQVICHVISRAA